MPPATAKTKSGKTTKAPSTKVDTRQLILAEALTQFSSVGFEGMTTRGLADACGINHSLIAYHYGNKLELWKAVMNGLFNPYRDNVQQRLAGLGDLEPEIAVKLIIRDFVVFCSVRPELHRIMTIEGRAGTDRLEWLVENHLRHLYTDISRQITAAQASGKIHAGNPAQLYYAIIALAGNHFSLAPEYELVTGLPAHTDAAIEETIKLINRVMFIEPA